MNNRSAGRSPELRLLVFYGMFVWYETDSRKIKTKIKDVV